jgi:MerR family transcriptional regulator, mercuric resistance operon regulatory protein
MSKANKQDPVSLRKNLSHCFEVTPDLQFMNTDYPALEFPLSISQLAKAAQTTVHTVRNYVIEGLLCSSSQTQGGYGLYDKCALNRLRFIRVARAAGLLIMDIKPLLYAINEGNNNACSEAIRLLQSKIDQRQAYLYSLDKQLSELHQID